MNYKQKLLKGVQIPITSMVSLSFLCLPLFGYVVSSYRHLHFTNTDVCDTIGSTKDILLGDGALVLSLNVNNKSFTQPPQKSLPTFCHVKIKAREGYGLMVFVEEFYLRAQILNGSDADCLDYLEFGQDDFIPLVTLERSEKLCQNKTGFHYDEPKGILLIWLKLGPPEVQGGSVVDPRLSLVITPYLERRTGKEKHMSRCARGNWIQTRYFCDGRVNCALDPQGLWTDEAPLSCRTTQVPKPKAKPTRPTIITTPPTEEWATGLNLSLGTIVLVSILSLSLIACLIVITLKQCGLLGGPANQPEEPGCPDQALGMLELSRTPARATENTYMVHQERSQPRPSPLRPDRSQASPAASRTPTNSRGGVSSPKEPMFPNLHPDEAPPPSYNEIFPPGTEPQISELQNKE